MKKKIGEGGFIMTEFKVGDKVGLNVSFKHGSGWDRKPIKTIFTLGPNEFEPAYGEIKSINGQKADVDWGESYSEALDHIDDDCVDLKDLLPAEEMKAKCSQLERDFEQLKKDIKVKLQEAASAIRAAQKMAASQNQKVVDMDEAYLLYPAMDEAGWRTSSFGC